MRNKHKLIEELSTPPHLEREMFREMARLKKQVKLIKQILEGKKDENHCDSNNDTSDRV